jgi:hypothetical protein
MSCPSCNFDSVSLFRQRILAYLEVAKNCPSGENCIWRTNAECAARSWVTFISVSLETKADILGRLNNTDSDVDVDIFLLLSGMSSFKLDDDVRRLRGGGSMTGVAVLSWVSIRALRIFIFRKAFFHNCLPTVVGVAAKLDEDSWSTGEFKGVGGTRGDVGVDDSLITAVSSDNRCLIGSYIWDRLVVGSPWTRASKSLSSVSVLRHVEVESTPTTRNVVLKVVFKWRPATKIPLCAQVIPECRQKRSLASMRTSLSHFWPRWREKIHLSEANHAETAARPNEVNAVRTVVIVAVTKAFTFG